MIKHTKIYVKKNKWIKIGFSMVLIILLSFLIIAAFKDPSESTGGSFNPSLPIIVIGTYGEDLAHNAELEEAIVNNSLMNLYSNSQKYEANLKLYSIDPYLPGNNQVNPELETEIVINARGQSSLIYPKKQYTVRFVDENGFENPQEPLKMAKHDKWVLNGMYSDKTMMRNYIAYKMGRQIMDYSPDTRYVEVYLKTHPDQSQEDQYQGIYLLTEKIERDINRVAISKNNEKYKDMSFIMARDKIKLGDIVIQTDWNRLEDEFIIVPIDVIKMKTVFTVSYPNKKNITDNHKKNIIKSINDFEYALQATNFKDKKEGYNEYINVESFIKFAMINEITKNIDGGEVSSYFHKNIGGKIKAGPIWDFDMSMGNTGIEAVDDPTGFLMLNTIWYDRLFQDEYFVKRYQNMYKSFRNTIWSDANINLLVEEALLELGPALERNNSKWYKDQSLDIYLEEVDDLREFLINRLKWIDNNLTLLKRIQENVVE